METLIVERKDGVVTVTMNRPESKNAANGKMLTELRTTFEEVEDNRDDRVMVLTGAGGAFCSGADLSTPTARPPTPPVRGWRACAASVTSPWPCTTSPSRPSPRWTGSPSAPACRSRSGAIWSSAAIGPSSP